MGNVKPPKGMPCHYGGAFYICGLPVDERMSRRSNRQISDIGRSVWKGDEAETQKTAENCALSRKRVGNGV